jgi:hypothetical protein
MTTTLTSVKKITAAKKKSIHDYLTSIGIKPGSADAFVKNVGDALWLEFFAGNNAMVTRRTDEVIMVALFGVHHGRINMRIRRSVTMIAALDGGPNLPEPPVG